MTICTLQEMADRLRIHPTTLYRLIRKRAYPGVFLVDGNKSWGYRFELETFMAALKEEGSKYARP